MDREPSAQRDATEPYPGCALETVRRRISIVEVGPELQEPAYALTREAWEDLPTGFPVETPDLATFLEEDLGGPIAFAALDDREVVGFGALMERDAPGLLEHGLTATRRTHRRRGIATALKRTQFAWAAANGYRELITFTQDGNEGMQAINVALGYERQPRGSASDGARETRRIARNLPSRAPRPHGPEPEPEEAEVPAQRSAPSSASGGDPGSDRAFPPSRDRG